MGALSGINPSCYLPSALNSWLPQAIACPPPPSVTDVLFASITRPLSATASAVKYTYDAFIGLQFLSFFLIPTVTSYSTSLNMLFFYLTWSTLVLSHDALQVEIVASFAIKILFYVLPSSIMLVFDLLAPRLSASVKRQGSDGLLLQASNRRTISKTLKVVGNSLTNILLGLTLQTGLEWFLTNWLEFRPALRVTTSLPLPWGMARDLLKGFLARDALTWLIRRYMLNGSSRSSNHVARDLSKLHKRWYHAIVQTPFPLSPSYDHPLVYLLREFLPVYLPVMFWNFHALTYMVYLALISLEQTLTHSGYARLPTHFILGGIAGRNDLYCFTSGKGNYGTWGLCDWLSGTSIGTEFADDVVDEMEEADVQGKLTRQADRSMAKVKRVANGRSGKEASANTTSKRRTRRTRSSSDSE